MAAANTQETREEGRGGTGAAAPSSTDIVCAVKPHFHHAPPLILFPKITVSEIPGALSHYEVNMG